MVKASTLDILAFGAHPDDVELGCGATLAKHARLGKKVGVVDLTLGELGTRGTPQLREAEANEAAHILGLQIRQNMGMRDGFFLNDETHQRQIISVIRHYRPPIVLANAFHDRHPDHGRAAQLVVDACFLAGLTKIITTDKQQQLQAPWRPKLVLHYVQDRWITPNILVDVSSDFDTKLASIRAYGSQFFDPTSQEPPTYIAAEGYLDTITARAKELGKYIDGTYAEGFLSHKMLGVTSLSELL